MPPHAVYWPIMLHAAGHAAARGILAHGWWTARAGPKMSKSTGNALDPLDFVGEFGVDAFRYFLIREMNVGQDSDFSREQFLVRYNGDLANDLGNLVNRVLNMTGASPGAPFRAAGAGRGAEAELRPSGRRPRRSTWRSSRDSSFTPRSSGSSPSSSRSTATSRSGPRGSWPNRPIRPTRPACATALATMAEALAPFRRGRSGPVMPGRDRQDHARSSGYRPGALGGRARLGRPPGGLQGRRRPSSCSRGRRLRRPRPP